MSAVSPAIGEQDLARHSRASGKSAALLKLLRNEPGGFGKRALEIKFALSADGIRHNL